MKPWCLQCGYQFDHPMHVDDANPSRHDHQPNPWGTANPGDVPADPWLIEGHGYVVRNGRWRPVELVEAEGPTYTLTPLYGAPEEGP